MKRASILLIVCLLLLGSALTTTAQDGDGSFIAVANTPDTASVEAALEAAGAKVDRSLRGVNMVVFEAADGDAMESVAGVEFVVPNIPMYSIEPVEPVSLDPSSFGNPPTSGDDDLFFDLQWGHDAVNAPEAWNAGVRGAGVVVAVLDEGFQLDHPDLAPNVIGTYSAVDGESVEYGIPGDPFSHGMHVAGTIAAPDNGYGVIGVAPEAKLLLVKVLSETAGSGSFADVIEGIVWAADNGADIINMSLGSGPIDQTVDTDEVNELRRATDAATTYAHNKGVVVIASAGNDAFDFDANPSYIHLPSDARHVISISATTAVGWAIGDPFGVGFEYPATYSNYGRRVIDFAGPGGDLLYPGDEDCTIGPITRPCFVFDLIFSVGSDNAWYWSGGTSMSAPHVAGVAALIISEHGGDMPPNQVERELRRRALDFGPTGADAFYGEGHVFSGYAEAASGPPVCDGKVATIYVNEDGVIVGGDQDGQPYSGTLNGTNNDDVIVGTNGPDNIYGRPGNDTICGLTGNDTINGENGHDRIFGNEGSDTLRGGTENDVIHGGDGNDSVYGGEHNDELYGNFGSDILDGENGDDRVYGDEGRDMLYGRHGNDYLNGGEGIDELHGGTGDDVLEGWLGSDVLYGGENNDRLYGGAEGNPINSGRDELWGGNGNDMLYGGDGHDTLKGEQGNDELYGGDHRDDLYGGNGEDKLYGEQGLDELYGEQGQDYLDGGDNSDYLFGGTGDDELHGGGGPDYLYGEDNNDRLYGEAGADVLDGGNGDDQMDGGGGPDILIGGENNDNMQGGNGNDDLDGGNGFDTCDGGSGTDTGSSCENANNIP